MALLQTRDLARAFGETQALADASFDVAAGEIHALVGENGSGKSTFVKIVTGVLKPDDGLLEWDGAPRRFASPRQGQAAGIVAVFQETLVVEELSVLDNVLLGTDGMIRHGAAGDDAARRVRATLDTLGLRDVDVDTPMWALSLSRRQMVTIARALVRPWKLLVLDEATSALDIEDRERLFAALKEARGPDAAVLFISHRMDEVRDVADRVTVMRAGRTVRTLAAAEASTDLLLELMSTADGRREVAPAPRRLAAVPAATVQRVRAVELVARATPIDLDVRAGEVLGLAGLHGHGQDRLLRCLAGHQAPAGGTVELTEDDGFTPLRGMRDAFRRGVAYVPGDRKREGIFGPLSVLDNQSLATLGRRSTAGVIRSRAVRAVAQDAVERLRIRTAGLGIPISGLSGGNQQKVLLARWLAANPRVLLLNDPLRGVDLGARLDVFEVFRSLAADGMALVFFSTEIEELLIACDRVAVLREQSVETVLEGERISQPAIIAAMFGQEAGAQDGTATAAREEVGR